MTPKQIFLSEPNRVKAHNEVVSTSGFRYALDMALLEYANNQSGGITPDQETSAALYHKFVGAKEFVKLLLNLGLVGETKTPQGLPPNLQHDV